MAREQVEGIVEGIVQGILTGSDIELVDVEYVKERDWYLRVFLDKTDGIEIEDCQWVSEQLEAKLDELDPIKDSYYLEVSSPGLDRPLKKEKDYIRHIGDKIEINTFAPMDGSKNIVGVLKGLIDNEIHIDIDGVDKVIPKDKVSQVRLYIEF